MLTSSQERKTYLFTKAAPSKYLKLLNQKVYSSNRAVVASILLCSINDFVFKKESLRDLDYFHEISLTSTRNKLDA